MSNIEWTDETWNPTVVPPLPDALGDPLHWRTPRRVFVNSMSDLFHGSVPFEFIAAVFGVMAACPQHTFQVLTKRPERARQFFAWAVEQDRPDGRIQGERSRRDDEGTPGRLECCWQALAHEARVSDSGPLHTKYAADPHGPWPLPNVWLGTSDHVLRQTSRKPRLASAPPDDVLDRMRPLRITEAVLLRLPVKPRHRVAPSTDPAIGEAYLSRSKT